MDLVYDHEGYCVICDTRVRFRAQYDWYRDWLVCSNCSSVPRERALTFILERSEPDWRSKRIHESSPVFRAISLKIKQQCSAYVPTQYFVDRPLGEIFGDFQNENLECTTFEDESFDIVLTLDVMEHVNDPQKVIEDVYRTLKPGGRYIFTVPTDKGRIETKRVARYMDGGGVEHYETPEYHGNPVSSEGALVTFRYGYNFANEITGWAPFDVHLHRFCRPHLGIIGEYTEVYECIKLSSS
jgi:SAM-dependent methyltransferase